MDMIVADAARAAAAVFPDAVGMELEVLLATDGAPQPPARQFDADTAIALAGLILAAAQFAWTIYNDMRKAGGAPTAEDVERRVIDRLQREGRLPPEPPARAAVGSAVRQVTSRLDIRV